MLLEGNSPKNCEPTARFSFTTIPEQSSVLVKDSLTKNNVTTLEHPIDFYLFPRIKSALNGQHFCDVPDTIKNATEEPKSAHKMGPRNVSSAFTVAGRSVQLHKGTVLKDM